jgi:two-component system, NtrC family, sensor histidine kinase HydH
MKRIALGGTHLASIGLAALAFAVLTALSVVIFRSMGERDILESSNDAERTMNVLLASLRDHDDFGSAIESIAELKKKVVGVGVYAEGGERIYAWGETPETFTQDASKDRVKDGAKAAGKGYAVRKYIENPRNDSLVLLLHPFRVMPAPPPPPEEQLGPEASAGDDSAKEKRDREDRGFLFTTMRKGEVVYLEIREPVFWARRRLDAFLFPAIEVALAALVFFIRSILLRNAEYRRRFEEQKSLVVLGTAASTLAHEIKNPLLSIRLQTRILEKTCPEIAQREIGIINAEVERLSGLSHRVGDYLRDPAGKPRAIDAADVALEVGMRLCGRNILKLSDPPPPPVSMDPERLRSVLENLLRNAIESGGPEEALSIEVGSHEGAARIDVLDRGTGLAPEARARLFDPFFTTKSRGTGIGLSICERFVAAAGGRISLEPRAEGGCRARVVLPAAEAKA